MFEIRNDIHENLNSQLATLLGSDLLKSEVLVDIPTYIIKKERITDVLKFLFDDELLKFQFLTSLCGVHYPENEGQELGVVYHIHSFTNNLRIRIKCFTSINNPVFPTITNIFSSANWLERETYDFYGILFEGHPNLKRILNIDEMYDFPLRKEFPLEDSTREDKNDSMFGR